MILKNMLKRTMVIIMACSFFSIAMLSVKAESNGNENLISFNISDIPDGLTYHYGGVDMIQVSDGEKTVLLIWTVIW